jgi:hypothetical protein
VKLKAYHRYYVKKNGEKLKAQPPCVIPMRDMQFNDLKYSYTLIHESKVKK